MKELQELRNEVLNLRNIGELTKQTESILLHKLNTLQEAISVTRCSTQLPTNEETNIEIKRLTDRYYNDEMNVDRKSAFGLGFSTGVGFCKTHIKKQAIV